MQFENASSQHTQQVVSPGCVKPISSVGVELASEYTIPKAVSSLIGIEQTSNVDSGVD